MRATSVMRFVIFGAVGFGIGGGISISPSIPSPGTGSLGLALKDWRRVVSLTVLGALGLTVGLMAGLILGPLVSYSEVPITVIAGAVVGGLLGAAFRGWRTILG